MTKFLIGLLLGLILGIGGAAAFLITAGGGDYFVGASPRVRELEASLREAEQERQWLRGRLSEATEMGNRLESRFIGLATRFEAITGTVRDTKKTTSLVEGLHPNNAPALNPSTLQQPAKPEAREQASPTVRPTDSDSAAPAP